MRIIGLFGYSNSGKSYTLNYLKKLLRAAGKSISSQPHPNCEDPETFEYKGLIVFHHTTNHRLTLMWK